MKHLSVIFVCLFFVMLSPAYATEMTDMHDRSIVVPHRVQKVVCASPPVTYMLYSIDPALIAGLNIQPDDNIRKIFHPDIWKRPVIGAFGGGQAGNFNPETLLAIKPDLVLAWPPRMGMPKVEQKLTALNIPLAYLSLDTMDNYPDAYEFLGKLLGRQQRCSQLANYFRTELKKLRNFSSGIPQRKRVSVYLAEDRDGLLTASANSVHSEAIALAGGMNAHKGESTNRRGKERISLEQVLVYDPDVIVVKDPAFFNSVYKDSRWAKVKAVRNHRVYQVPAVPFSWLDQPPSFMRLLGAKWLAHTLYPDSFKTNIAAETRHFFALFFGSKLSEQDVRAMLVK